MTRLYNHCNDAVMIALIAGTLDPAEASGKVIAVEAVIGYLGSRVTDLLIGGEKVQIKNEALRSAVMGSGTGRMNEPTDADREHVPELEQWACNQMPKTRDHHDVKLYRYVGTDLYQWYSKIGTSVFSEPRGEPFVGEKS